MKAIAKTKPAFGAELVDIAVPRPGRDELLVKIAACGICGSDLHIYEWELGAERFAPRLPMVLGHEPAGEVVEVGPEVIGFKRGDHVALDPFGHCGRCPTCLGGRFNLCTVPTTLSGAFAEYTIAPARNAYVVPANMNMEQAALLEPFATGLHGVEQSGVKAGDRVVVEGPGPIGLCTALSARCMGAASIVITGLRADSERLELARRFGFHTVCAEDEDWTAQVADRIGEEGADVVFDAAGMMDSVRHLVKRGGQLVLLGWPARDLPSAEMRSLFFHGVNIISSRVRTPQTWRRAIALVAGKTVDLAPMVTHRVDLANGLEAFELLRRKEGVKVLVNPAL
ncbi:MAG TPA: alcohol dehydrogenase catalytic domain-containing protein [Candidatus Binataceae bacterium]|nr:alcohol dehydrogenase catalytic domain-containing protein [Candidatus Binataceae bacterium]